MSELECRAGPTHLDALKQAFLGAIIRIVNFNSHFKIRYHSRAREDSNIYMEVLAVFQDLIYRIIRLLPYGKTAAAPTPRCRGQHGCKGALPLSCLRNAWA